MPFSQLLVANRGQIMAGRIYLLFDWVLSEIKKGRAMILVIRRMLLLVSLMLWQGGFMFYGGVVVPVGARVLGSEREQGFITQSVTDYLNVAGAVCLIVFLEHLWHDRRNGVSKMEWGLWSAAVVSVVVLAGVHVQMDQI